ncbi:MAG: nucleotidyltransferase domain-containing protein [Acidobacteria bacterium]|nr:nucleotidyltransferase domain-containing protein [Acidobacteriota bacterium]
MGTKEAGSAPSRIADALLTPVQQRLLGLLFGQPDRRFQSAEIIRLAAGGTGAAHRQLQRLGESGLLTVSREGAQKYYQANRESPVYAELHGLIVKTVGLVDPLREALRPLADQIRAAFVFGSLAKKSDRAASDVDVLIVSDMLTYPDVYEALQNAEARISRPINPTVFSRNEWRRKAKATDSFAKRVAAQPKIFVIGDEDALA